ncbi:hypothetical protein V6N13_129112 [Hibiscus sabdariffa]
MSIGSGPCREFEDKFRISRPPSLVKVEGIEEENILEPRIRFLKEKRLPKQAENTTREPERFPIKLGSLPPINVLPPKPNVSKPLQFVKDERKLILGEVKLLASRLRSFKFMRLPRVSGMDPEM